MPILSCAAICICISNQVSLSMPVSQPKLLCTLQVTEYQCEGLNFVEYLNSIWTVKAMSGCVPNTVYISEPPTS